MNKIKFKKVKYKVTDAFGDSQIGDIFNSILVAKDGNFGLLYHPKTSKYTCSSFEICEFIDNIWQSIDNKQHAYGQNYVNVIKNKKVFDHIFKIKE